MTPPRKAVWELAGCWEALGVLLPRDSLISGGCSVLLRRHLRHPGTECRRSPGDEQHLYHGCLIQISAQLLWVCIHSSDYVMACLQTPNAQFLQRAAMHMTFTHLTHLLSARVLQASLCISGRQLPLWGDRSGLFPTDMCTVGSTLSLLCGVLSPSVPLRGCTRDARTGEGSAVPWSS